MYKIVLYDSLDNILDQEYYLIEPSQDQVGEFLMTAWRRFGLLVKAKVESVKYINLGKVS